MTWSITTTGTKDEAIAAVEAASPPHDESRDFNQYRAAKDHILDELAAVPDGSIVSVSAFGHTGELESNETIAIKATPAPSDG